ncbi:hypothetical protein CFU_3380 [Collimonas fungivorans Ter331]|uniref:Uncharacterized protein n=1 Tax=Collimonas fungivorans (strain Ter331) TaxID=1005048 RepID=G0AAJ0_COLFT|nr:hypothetical protein CFU_3380 [Collimonas fungivorans Ter331]
MVRLTMGNVGTPLRFCKPVVLVFFRLRHAKFGLTI